MLFWKSLSFQDILSSAGSSLVSLHDGAMVWLVVIIINVAFVTWKVFFGVKGGLSFNSEVLESTWTSVPMIMLLIIGTPSLSLLFVQDSIYQSPKTSLKILSEQWSWQSESFSSSLKAHLMDLDKVEVQYSLELPVSMKTGVSRLITSSSDVLHSLGVPSLSMKLDSVPGRLNMFIMDFLSKGLFLGSCYELCGSGHSSMPISFVIL